MSRLGSLKHCLVAYAAPDRQYLWSVAIPEVASVEDALAAARALAESGGDAGDASAVEAPQDAVRPPGARSDIPWTDARVGIFGQLCERSVIPREGDRIELYRPLRQDPKQARRERARRRA